MTWMIYGANGYTGRLIADQAVARGHTPILAGRHPQRVVEIARDLNLPSRIFDLRRGDAVARELSGVTAVLHCAGPFSATARPMLDGCLKAQVHYLDITGEIDVFEMIHGRDAELKAAGIVAIPGVGFDVVPSDCLAALLKERLPEAERLTLAFMPRGARTSPGTAKTMVEGFATGGRVREGGVLKAVPAAHRQRTIPFPGGPAPAMTIPWGDVSTAYVSTGIPNIEVYIGTSRGQVRAAQLARRARWLLGLKPVSSFLKRRIEKNVHGPSAERRARGSTALWGEAVAPDGRRVTLGMRTPDGYALTAESAVKAVERLLAKPPPPGALTPSLAFGAAFIKELEGVELFT